MRDALGQGDAVALAKLGHKLKGAAAVVCAAEASAVAARIEARARAGDLHGVPEALDELAESLRRAEQAMRASTLLSGAGVGGDPAAS